MAEARPSNAEPDEVEVRGVGWGVAVIVGGIVISLVMAWLFSGWTGNRSGTNNAAAPNPPAPALRSAPLDERAAYFREKQDWLRSYGWVDRAAGRARIPVDEAIELMTRDTPRRDRKAGGQ
jgi:hypothetical protein